MIAVTDCSATVSSLLSALTKADACPKVILYSLNPPTLICWAPSWARSRTTDSRQDPVGLCLVVLRY